MKVRILTFLGFSFILFAASCSKETPPININGFWKVEFYEVNGCVDSLSNFTWDLMGMGCEIDTSTNEEICRSLAFMFDSLGTYQYFISNLNVTQQDSFNITTAGDYELLDNNSLRICPDGFACDTLLFVRQDSFIDLVNFPDTLTGCGIHRLMRLQ